MEKGANFAVPWEVQETKSLDPAGSSVPRPRDRLVFRALALSPPEIPDFPLPGCWDARINTQAYRVARKDKPANVIIDRPSTIFLWLI